MKSLKMAFLVALSALFAGSFMYGQPAEKGQGRKGGGGGGRGGRGGMTAEARVTALDQAVALTADQKTKITAIYTKLQEKIQAIPQEERFAKMQELNQAASKEVRALLTPEQQAKFDAMPPPGRGGGRGKKQ
jgi:Spy/CpxP family protein refolding chaperone